MRGHIGSFLPGKLWIERGTVADFAALERFHYRKGRPATWAGVWVVRYDDSQNRSISQTPSPRPSPEYGRARAVAVAVLSYPGLNSAARDAALELEHVPPGERISFVNRNVRTISRVIVHPQFRSVGVASKLVRWICGACPTRFVEAYAWMGRVHPFFEKGGMRKAAVGSSGPVYYWRDNRVGVE